MNLAGFELLTWDAIATTHAAQFLLFAFLCGFLLSFRNMWAIPLL
jgi:hypothetical protein